MGLDKSVTSRKSFRRIPSSASMHGRTQEVGLDASVTCRKPFMRRSASSASMTGHTREVGLDESVAGRRPFRRANIRIPETVPDKSFSSCKPFLKQSASLTDARDASASDLEFRDSRSNSGSSGLSCSGLCSFGNSLHNSGNSGTSIPSLAETNLSLEINDALVDSTASEIVGQVKWIGNGKENALQSIYVQTTLVPFFSQ